MRKKKITIISISILTLFLFSSFTCITADDAANNIDIKNNISKFFDNSYFSLYCVLPSNAVVNEPIDITIQAWDWAERISKKSFDSFIVFSSTDDLAILPDKFIFKESDSGVKTFREAIVFNSPGIHYVIIKDLTNDIVAVSNPVQITEEESEYKWYWGDIHFHSMLSDGSATINYVYNYARDVSMLDFCSLTDHDYCWELKLNILWKKTGAWFLAKNAASKFYEPGKFVTLLAYEYTNYKGDGHYNVYYNTVNDAPFYNCQEEHCDRVADLWSLLSKWKEESGFDVFTIPHHPMDDSKYWNSSNYDPELVPLIEIFQNIGSSEMSSDRGNPIDFRNKEITENGHTVQDGLAKGYKFGLISASDDHTGHPGHRPYVPAYSTEPISYFGPIKFIPRGKLGILHLYLGFFEKLSFYKELFSGEDVIPEYLYPNGGISGVYAKNLTRKEIFSALKDRRCIAATNCNRLIANFTVNNKGIGSGSEVHVKDTNTPRYINCSVSGTAPIVNISVIKNNDTFYYYKNLQTDTLNLSLYQVNFSIIDNEPITGVSWDEELGTDGRDFYYLRIKQSNNWYGWMGPIWVNPLN